MTVLKAIWPPAPGTRGIISLEEFKNWLLKFDKNGDGKICAEELRAAIRANGGWFSKWKAKSGLRIADKNSDGVIDDNEISYLVDFAQKHFGMSARIKVPFGHGEKVIFVSNIVSCVDNRSEDGIKLSYDTFGK